MCQNSEIKPHRVNAQNSGSVLSIGNKPRSGPSLHKGAKGHKVAHHCVERPIPDIRLVSGVWWIYPIQYYTYDIYPLGCLRYGTRPMPACLREDSPCPCNATPQTQITSQNENKYPSAPHTHTPKINKQIHYSPNQK